MTIFVQAVFVLGAVGFVVSMLWQEFKSQAEVRAKAVELLEEDRKRSYDKRFEIFLADVYDQRLRRFEALPVNVWKRSINLSDEAANAILERSGGNLEEAKRLAREGIL